MITLGRDFWRRVYAHPMPHDRATRRRVAGWTYLDLVASEQIPQLIRDLCTWHHRPTGDEIDLECKLLGVHPAGPGIFFGHLRAFDTRASRFLWIDLDKGDHLGKLGPSLINPRSTDGETHPWTVFPATCDDPHDPACVRQIEDFRACELASFLIRDGHDVLPVTRVNSGFDMPEGMGDLWGIH